MYTIPEVRQVTNFYGKIVGDETEPLHGSVVLVGGAHGTAWQRYFSTGLWHRVGGGRGREWTELLQHRNLVAVYDAAPRARDLQSESDALAEMNEEAAR